MSTINNQPSSSNSEAQKMELTVEQLALIERNRQKALLKQQKNQRNLTTDEAYQLEKYDQLKVKATQDHGGGFFVNQQNENSNNKNGDQPVSLTDKLLTKTKQQNLPIKLDTKENVCEECEDNFSNSYLYSNFGELICDLCKDLKGKHCLMTRTEAKQEYLLTDVDLDKREPPLRCVLKKNPHEFARGQMRLYLRMHVEERALEVWGTEERLEEERENREAKREGRKRKHFDKQMKDLRMQARSSLYQKRLQSAGHEHVFGEEIPIENKDDPDGDYYQQICQQCGLKKVFEKL